MTKTAQNPARTRASLADIKAAAHGRWPDILQALGVPRALLDTRKHQPCPACGGKDRFRFTDHQGGGGFICNQCTPEGGSGFDLLMLVYGYPFAESVASVAALLDMGGRLKEPPRPLPPRRETPPDTDAERAQKLRRVLDVWQAGTPFARAPDLADYFFNRGIPAPEYLPVSDDLRWLEKTAYRHDGQTLGHFPAMCALFRNAAGEPCGLHLTYLQWGWNDMPFKARIFDPKTRQALPVKKMRNVGAGSLKGAAIRLFEPENGVLAVCEGIETALAARYVSGVAVWACGSAHGIASLVLPDNIREVAVIADNDAAGTGIKATYALQRRYHGKLDAFRIWRPDGTGADALDVLTANVAKGAAA